MELTTGIRKSTTRFWQLKAMLATGMIMLIFVSSVHAKEPDTGKAKFVSAYREYER